MNRAVFLDLNGTLVEPVQVESLGELRVLPGVLEAVAKLHVLGFLCPIVTVQSRIAKEVFSLEAFVAWFENFQARAVQHGAHLLGPYVCPHRFSETCACQKPKPFLYEQAAQDNAIDLPNSYVVGDTLADVEAALAFGGTPCLVKTGWGHFESNLEGAKRYGAFVTEDITDAVTWIMERERAKKSNASLDGFVSTK